MKPSITITALTTLLLSTLSLANTVKFDASFDDLKTLPGVGELSPVGIYHGLNFSTYIVASLSELNESASGVIPHSDPNVGLTINNPSTITVLYSSSETESFSLSSFYYGCDVADLQGFVSLAKACTITASGYKAGSSSPVATQVFDFQPLQAVDVMNPPTFGTFSSKFQGLQTVTFAVTPTTLTAFIIDDLVGSTMS